MSHRHLFPNYSFQLISSFFFFLFLLNIKSTNASTSNEYLGSTGKHLFHFVQVTDTHITRFGNADRMEQFEQFCNQIIRTLIKPQVTIVSGDLVNSAGGFTHNRDRIFESAQYEQEWNIYKDILMRTNVTKSTAWLDMRGNHDAFMDPDPVSTKSFYRIYSQQGHKHNGSYEYTLRTNDGDSYSFVSIDMCPRPGAGRPFNVLGQLTKEEKKTLEKLSEQTKNSTSIIFFGHYPLAFTYSEGLDEIMKHGIVYLNGHLHSGVKHLYARHSTGLLELELGDWKQKRRFRIVTIDSGLLSFEDYRFSQPIYAVISNPKAAKFKTPREPLYRLSQSTHIRILIFANLSINDVSISIDGQFIGSAIQSIDNRHLFVLPWNASYYNDGHLHQISVDIKDNGNNTLNLKHEFSLSISTLTSWYRAKIILLVHWPTLGLVTLIISLFAYIFVLVFFRYQAKRRPTISTGRFGIWNRFRLRMMLLCSVDLIYYSLIGLALYHFIGPWYIGYLTEGHIGAVFLWGIVLRGMYLAPDSQLFMANFQLYFIIFPMTFALSSTCFYRYIQLQSYSNMIKPRFNRCIRNYSVYILPIYSFIMVIFWSFVATASYKLAWIISPFGLILAIFFIVLYIKSQRLKIEDFKLLSLNTNSVNQDNSKLMNRDEEPQVVLPIIKSQ